ncbi:PHF5-like protein [Trichomonas vaginalis G3]|uniref:PHF5-like protein n=1 Tax=Trichomonas vaginalis (strain ATCC PRA-98 / G3) TaxID=412133 RepID=A2DS54_TRIV3|nr:mRNA splicing, via spliceosome [Trichomonas vaginalis G3]EAY16824.1 PHF5-like protein [Trichomonas vaginalis G3]KAI5490765.1 mRNA splicing, via spliceosome [Trichomonas vaginalis G3]|eukprot:XP_001329047.1 PHF5-like protein [Trichomonas vaginalis G3]
MMNPDSIKCGGRPGPEFGLVCEACEGRCPICNAPVKEDRCVPVHICGECSFGQLRDKCIVCSAPAKYKAYYCEQCSLLGKDRDGCPRIINVGINRSDRFYERKRVTVIPEQKF